MEGSRKNALLELLVDARRVAAHDAETHRGCAMARCGS